MTGEGTVEVVVLDDAGEDAGQMARDVRAGLAATPKDLSPWPKYFYDAEGSRLFEEITAQPEYYQTEAELSILVGRSEEIVARTRCRELVELGSGSASKTRALIDAMFAADGLPPRYVPLDVSESALRESGERLVGEYPGLEIRGFIGDFDLSLGRLLGRPSDRKRLVAFLGGTIGNFTPEKRRGFLGTLRDGLREGDRVLIGLDLVKDERTLRAAYNDAAGVTARFNRNMIRVINHRLGAGLDPDLFSHSAVYDAGRERIEMWLHSSEEQTVSTPHLEARFGKGEGVRTEISTKFTPDSAARTFEEAGLRLLDLYTDDRDLFALALGGPA
ncbi:MAG: L-histidine N(alpha)-methyltransferase [uncultured Rubrobacteraceae bacterium]|uniref:L-histidine N(Alpha)-methyltransferase n=1 Tax=uncultured Rubrobacteraceae bacterium TaxID=349277 RepID=A0A6J4PLE8_9ACTN|nr:MAG: L-histidine N(alpha)-methyltransferase [uncultured Rubrobacteraceae bacterium]